MYIADSSKVLYWYYHTGVNIRVNLSLTHLPPDVVGGPVECVQISGGEALDKVQGEAAGERQDDVASRVSHFIEQCTLNDG